MAKQIVLCNMPKPMTAPEGVSEETFEALSAKHGWDYKAMLVEQKDLRLQLSEAGHSQFKLSRKIDEMEYAHRPPEEVLPLISQHQEGCKRWEELAALYYQVKTRVESIWKEAAAGLKA